jgi:hypothetical protein
MLIARIGKSEIGENKSGAILREQDIVEEQC